MPEPKSSAAQASTSAPPVAWLDAPWPDDLCPPRHNLVFVLSGPAGVGKDTVIEALKPESFSLHRVVTVTTRPPRSNEVEGVSYRFVTADQFDELRETGGLLEWAKVSGYEYGTPAEQVRKALQAGNDLLLKIDVQGAAQVKRRIPQAVLIFLAPPTMDALIRRLTKRATEAPQDLARRIRSAREEMKRLREYDYVVVNFENRSAEAAAQVRAIITAERLRTFPRQIQI